ncbi:hypothetical protein PY365_21210 [Roseiarcaceae bacterium H3SJ34-1]|uniref:hypothetical protein n=1 Tax=Terripilifer ovatus TaxID=3032367 RepID=UPI003AB9B806|nr:hypothetical protein [Roseiarcaceae bacterium H3SJ34-1]
MKKTMVLLVLAGACFVGQAQAQERLRDGAVGAVGGAVVGGPVGAAVGGVGGYVAGPAITRGVKRAVAPRRYHAHRRYHRR